MRKFRLLKASEIECRINQITKNGCGLLLYKTARTDYALLDEEIGLMNWQNDYKVIDGKMYCGIGIRSESGEWIWKWNCGTESNQDAEKGQASDAMKRAGFAWGIGTELYSSPFIWIPSELCNTQERNGKMYCNDKFYVKHIAYSKGEEISELEIVNGSSGATVYTYPRKKTAEKPSYSAPAAKQVNTQPQPEKAQSGAKCVECGADVQSVVKDYSEKYFGRCLCRDCQKKYGRR